MDRRSWPWKKKSSEKTATNTDSISASVCSPGGNQTDQDDDKREKYIQISVESYAHFNDLEDQLKNLQEKLTSANEELSSSQSDVTAKDILVKQHAKVAEEAVSGWEKAEAEAAALKHQLETVTLLKLTLEERSSHLDGALKECMKQIRNVKEESEQKLQDVIFAKTRQWEKIKSELEVKIDDFEQEFLRADAENAALSRSLNERSNMLMKIVEEKSQVVADNEVLKDNIQSCEKEINSLKYELHVISKELEIRNEEKNMSVRSAEVVTKQHLEDVKKITKLEAECQRLRGLVRKKLPGPAALAQMKVEVENLGRDYGETRVRRSPVRASSPRHLPPVPDFALENIQQYHKENEFLTARLLAMEEEMKMLKEALSKRNSELQSSRNMCAKAMNKLHSLEAQNMACNQQKCSPKPNIDINFENGSSPPSLTSMSEDGIDEEGSCSESCATGLIPELSHFKKDKDMKNGTKAEQLELMDDFLEMERLACISTEDNGKMSVSGVVDNVNCENDGSASSFDVQKDGFVREQPHSEPAISQGSGIGEHPEMKSMPNGNNVPLLKLQSRIATVFESGIQHNDMTEVLENIKRLLQDAQAELPQHSVNCATEGTQSMATCQQSNCDEAMGEVNYEGSSLNNSALGTHTNFSVDQELKDAISQINDFVKFLSKEALQIHCSSYGNCELTKKSEEFSSYVSKVLCHETSLNDFILALSRVLSEATDMNFSMLGVNGKERDSRSSEFVDKVTLLENRVDEQKPTQEIFLGTCLLPPSSDIEIERGDNFEVEPKTTLHKCSLEEYEQLIRDKENMQMDLARNAEMLEQTKLQLVETEQQMMELKSQLAASEKSISLAETQLKCMVESYKTLESRTQELETEISLLRMKAETLDNELQEERHSYQDMATRYKELQEQIERNEKVSTCPTLPGADVDNKTKQENEITATEEKLAEFQETILLLGKQLKALHPPAEVKGSSVDSRHTNGESTMEDEPRPSSYNFHHMNITQNTDQVEMESSTTDTRQRAEGESPLGGYDSHVSPSDTEAGPFPGSPISSKRQRHRSSGSSSSSSSSNAMSEKHGRGFSRFFSKGNK